MTCRLMKELENINGVKELPKESIEELRVLVCGTHSGVCNEKYFSEEPKKDLIEFNQESCSWCKNEDNCPYRRKTMEAVRTAVASIIYSTKAYCSGRVTCDYYIRDNDKYYKYNIGCVKGE